MGWTETEQLLCVLEDGTVRMYNILGEYTQFSLGKVHNISRVVPRVSDFTQLNYCLSYADHTTFCVV